MSDAMIWIGGAAIIAFTVGYCLRAAHKEPDPEENVKARQLAYSTGQRAANDRIREIYGDRWDDAACEFTLHFLREDAERAEITDDIRFPWFEAGYKQRLENLNRRYEQRLTRLARQEVQDAERANQGIFEASDAEPENSTPAVSYTAPSTDTVDALIDAICRPSFLSQLSSLGTQARVPTAEADAEPAPRIININFPQNVVDDAVELEIATGAGPVITPRGYLIWSGIDQLRGMLYVRARQAPTLPTDFLYPWNIIIERYHQTPDAFVTLRIADNVTGMIHLHTLRQAGINRVAEDFHGNQWAATEFIVAQYMVENHGYAGGTAAAIQAGRMPPRPNSEQLLQESRARMSRYATGGPVSGSSLGRSEIPAQIGRGVALFQQREIPTTMSVSIEPTSQKKDDPATEMKPKKSPRIPRSMQKKKDD